MHPIITISGTPGSGKSTVAKILIEKLNAERIYVGGIRRQLAKDKGMNLGELNQYGLEHPETDVEVDKLAAATAKKAAANKTVIVEGRTQFHFLPESIKLYIKVDPQEGARRIWQDLQDEKGKTERNEKQLNSLEEVAQETALRDANDASRYKKYYGLDYKDESQYDFVLDTTHISAQAAAEKILIFIEKRLNS